MEKWSKKLAESLLGIYAAPINLALRCIPEKRVPAIKRKLVKKLYSKNEYCQVSFFPKRVDDMPIRGTKKDFHDVAIVLQGPVLSYDDFTMNTVRMYRKYYPNAIVIVSTWIDTPPKAAEELRQTGAVVLLNEYPENNCKGNLNYQLISSVAGVREAKKLGARYAVKTRTDQRYYDPCALSLLCGMYQQDKLVLMGGVVNSFYAREFYISDFMTFGAIGDVELYYECEFDEEDVVRARDLAKASDDFKRYIEYVKKADLNCMEEVPSGYEDAVTKYACSEIRLAYSYFLRKSGKIGMEPKKAYDLFLREYAVVVDGNSLGFFWMKYDNMANDPSYFYRDGKFDMAKWCDINS